MKTPSAELRIALLSARADRGEWKLLRNHAAIEHFVGYGSCNPVDEFSAHLRIIAKNANGPLFLHARRSVFAFLCPQLCSQDEVVYFWTILLAIESTIGYWP
jgi:hypothetical protein